jgi:hypothetical protein
MNLEITPEPTEAERAAIAAALVQETEPRSNPWEESDPDDCEEIPRP